MGRRLRDVCLFFHWNRGGGKIFIFSLLLFLVAGLSVLLWVNVAQRRQWLRFRSALSAQFHQAQVRLERSDLFLSVDPQILIIWSDAQNEPDIEGTLPFLEKGETSPFIQGQEGDFLPSSRSTSAPPSRRVLAFGAWLPSEMAQKLQTAVDRLRKQGESFRLDLVTRDGHYLESFGCAIAGRAVLRLRDISEHYLALKQLEDSYLALKKNYDNILTFFDHLQSPVWVCGGDEQLLWVNKAYRLAVEVPDLKMNLDHRHELLDAANRQVLQKARRDKTVWEARVPVIVAGDRHMMDVLEVPVVEGFIGIAQDVSEIETLQVELNRLTEDHVRTLDQLSTGVAIFDRSRRLLFHNAAYRQVWGLESAFLDLHPLDAEILDRLRAQQRLPEQADFKSWKAQLHQAYLSNETHQYLWYLPDGRSLRVVVSPNPQGGLTYLFDDVTEHYHLESRYNALIRVQGETLDTLQEGVAVFGTDGCLKLFNPSFASLWKLDPILLQGHPHIEALAAQCHSLEDLSEGWKAIRALVAGLQEERTSSSLHIKRKDGISLDCAIAPLPDGATLLTFTDVTARVEVERVLKERNQALLEAEKLRNDFVHHVSYELRSPLTNIIGFTQLLGDQHIGSLNDKQREYASYIMKSSAALLAIINDILDLATIDRGALDLSLEEVDIEQAIQAAAQGIQDRLLESNIQLNIVIMDSIGSMEADSKRLRQILFNLLSNAIGFSEAGQMVTLAALRRDGEIVFKVSDQGSGIPPEMLDHVFDRFRSMASGSRHRGVGLGLSIVRALIELHKGQIHITSVPGEGTLVTCIFPATQVTQGTPPVHKQKTLPSPSTPSAVA